MEIDIYDFDKTLIPFDSGSMFIGFCFLHYPYLFLLFPVFFPVAVIGLVLSLLGIVSFTSFKRICFCFVALIPLDKAVKKFWDRHEKQVHKWYFDNKRYHVVISASPDFLLDEIKQRIGIDKLICTRHSRKTGAIIGKNCRGEEKVRRLYEELDMNNIRVIDVYSDSITHDKPIFSLATNNCYHVTHGKINKFKFNDKYKD